MADKVTVPLFKVFMPESVRDAVNATLFSGYIAEGETTDRFCQQIADFIGNPRTIVVNSGTTALLIAYRLAGIGPGDEVITTPLTSIATNVPILSLGAKPVWADCDRQTGMLDPESIENKITAKTKAVVVLHKDGDLARLDEIMKVAAVHGIKVIEDAAHVFGARYHGKRIGNHGDYACFSFQAIKHLTTGDGGALSCKDDNDYKRARKLKWFGVDHATKKFGNPWLQNVNEVGYKGNMNDIAAAIGIEQLKHTQSIIEKHNENGILYSSLLEGRKNIALLPRDKRDYPVYWVYTLLVEHRDSVIKALSEAGYGASQIHPRNDVWEIFHTSKAKLQNTDYFDTREISVPCGWWVNKEDIKNICEIISDKA